MKVARKLWTWALALVATFALVLGLSTISLADEIAAPETNKTLHDNGDGSYTLSLSVTGRADSTSETDKANVIIIFDSSGSMGDNVDTSTYVENPTGRYGLRNGLHVQLYTRSGYNYQAINNDTTTRRRGRSTTVREAAITTSTRASGIRRTRLPRLTA